MVHPIVHRIPCTISEHTCCKGTEQCSENPESPPVFRQPQNTCRSVTCLYLNVNNLPLTTAQTQGLKERPPLGSLLDPIFPAGRRFKGTLRVYFNCTRHVLCTRPAPPERRIKSPRVHRWRCTSERPTGRRLRPHQNPGSATEAPQISPWARWTPSTPEGSTWPPTGPQRWHPEQVTGGILRPEGGSGTNDPRHRGVDLQPVESVDKAFEENRTRGREVSESAGWTRELGPQS